MAAEKERPDRFTDFAARPQRLRRFLDAYGRSGSLMAFIEVVQARAEAHAEHAEGIRRLAAGGDPLIDQLPRQGVAADLDRAVVDLSESPADW